jgi:succinate dehydrogenase/fumarate reductase cytochrome b subunit
MAVTASNERFLDRHYFLIRRLHSLSGVFPIGVFLFPHLLTNSSIVWGDGSSSLRTAMRASSRSSTR